MAPDLTRLSIRRPPPRREVLEVDVPVRYKTELWAVHRPFSHLGAAGTVKQDEKGWTVTCRRSGLKAWEGTNLETAKRVARALQKASEQHGRIPTDGKAPRELLVAHLEALKAVPGAYEH